MSDSRVHEGGCLCGKIRWRASGKSLYAMNCHCRQCSKQTGSAFATGEIGLLIGSFDHPEEIQPSAHMMTEKQLPWLKIDDGLPRYPKFPPGDDYQDQGL